MKKIDISTPKHPNTFALVDDEDYARLNEYKWSCAASKCTKYAKRGLYVNKKKTSEYMHRVAMNAVAGQEIDHINNNGLDNRRLNLRFCTHQQNLQNRQLNNSDKCGYKGVHWDKDKWAVRIGGRLSRVRLGRFFCLIKAAKAYDKAAKEMYGEFAWLNFPE